MCGAVNIAEYVAVDIVLFTWNFVMTGAVTPCLTIVWL